MEIEKHTLTSQVSYLLSIMRGSPGEFHMPSSDGASTGVTRG
jgi:hypothetical protein